MQQVNVWLATDDEASVATRERLISLLDRFDLSRWIYTDEVIIERGAIPHSHPVLTLHTRHLGQDDLLLSTFLHEQLHWFLVAQPDSVCAAMLADFRGLFPDVPVGFPEGGDDEESTYLHLAVNYLKWIALHDVLGDDAARAVMETWTTDHYTWIYRTVLDEREKIGEIMVKHGLVALEDAV